jgi:hypothetical protein
VLGSDELYREWAYAALSRHREQARFYVVSPGSVERALPGLDAEFDDLHDDVRVTLSTRRTKDMALDVLARGGVARTVAALDEIAQAEQRIADTQAERDASSRLRRARRAAIEQDLARQEAAIERWAAQADEAARTVPLRPPGRAVAMTDTIDPDAARMALLDPSSRVSDMPGNRPTSLRRGRRGCARQRCESQVTCRSITCPRWRHRWTTLASSSERRAPIHVARVRLDERPVKR